MKDKILNIWAIAAKDIREAFSNRLVISILISTLVMLVLPKWLGGMIAPSTNEVLVYDPGATGITESLQDGGFSVVTVRSVDDLISAVQRGTAVSGLAIPEDLSQSLELGQQPVIRGYITWSDRGLIPELRIGYQKALNPAVAIEFDSQLLYPGPETFSLLGISFLTMLVVMLVVGISLVPSLIFEEKQTKTLDALLVSPATEAQLVAAKALVGLFYTLIVAVLLFGLNWNSVVHWELTVVFTMLCGLFAVSVGLVLGSVYQRQQDISGITTLLLVLFVGGIFVVLIQLSIPTMVGVVLDWLPSTQLFYLLQTIFYQRYTWGELLPGLLSVGGITILLYAVVVWKLRQSDR
jgi:ABC-2 type transport system permease protein